MRFHRDEIENYDEYFKRIKKIKPKTVEEEKILFLRYRSGDRQALDTIIKSNMKFVSKIAIEYLGYGVSFDDLLSEGNIGLMVAATKFDPERGVKFITYAVYWIRDYIKSFVSKSIRSTEYGYDDILSSKEDDDGDEDFCISRDTKPESYNIEDSIVKKMSISKYVMEMLDVLTEKERNVIKMYYGIGDCDDSDLKEISKAINVSKERVRQIIESSMKKMRIAAISRNSFLDDKQMS